MIDREVAWRVFAAEYNSSTTVLTGGEKVPSYVVTPIGAKINRMFIMGTLVEIHRIATEDDTPLIRARVEDPTGTFYVITGKYTIEATKVIENLIPPQYIAIIGKSRAYQTKENRIFVDIRPETAISATRELYYYWIYETAKSLSARIDFYREAKGLQNPNVETLTKLGAPLIYAEGICEALKHYPEITLEKYELILSDALHYIVDEPETTRLSEKEYFELTTVNDETSSIDGEASTEVTLEQQTKMMTLMEQLDPDNEGIKYETLVEKSLKNGFTKESVEETLNVLRNMGKVFEPKLGKFYRV